MALEEIAIDLPSSSAPQEVTELVAEANLRIDAFFESEENKRFPQYLPSDPLLLHGALAELTRRDLPLGRVFCEWGSGFGVATCVAALLGYDAYGLEIESELIVESRSLASDLNIPAHFCETSYVPAELDSFAGVGGEELIRTVPISYDGIRVDLTYEGTEIDISEIDVFFVYPWPGDQDFMQQLFDAVAVEGAILLAIHAEGDIYAHRKVFED